MFYECKEQSTPRASVKSVEKVFPVDETTRTKAVMQERAQHVEGAERGLVQLKPNDQGRGIGRSDDTGESGRGQVTDRLVGQE